MIGSLLGRFRGLEPAAPPRVPDNTRVYVVGDVHGRLDLLKALAEQIDRDMRGREAALTVFLGDYIDRGPDSAGVLDMLGRGDFPTAFVALRGNHEDVLLSFLDDEKVLGAWRNFGGLETLHSYGVNVADAMRGEGFGAARKDLLGSLPARHVDFLKETRFSLEVGDYFFCHAGVKPGTPLDRQTPNDLLWIREEFLKYRGRFDKIVVHGHTPVPEPDIRPNRINVDTGAYASSILTALVLEGDARRFLNTHTPA